MAADTVPATGGTAVQVAGSLGYLSLHGSAWLAKGGLPAALFGSEVELWNVVTGERRPVVQPPDGRVVHCLPRWCLGGSKSVEAGPAVQRPDGSGYRRFSLDKGGPRGVADGRFWTGPGRDFQDEQPIMSFWDVETGRAAAIGRPGILERGPDFDSFWLLGPVISWPSGDRLLVLDLASIT